MNFRQFGTSEFGTRLWLGLGRRLPPAGGRALARAVSAALARRRRSELYRSLRANQSVVLGPDATDVMLDRAVAAVLQHAGMVSWDLAQAVARGEEAVRAAVTFDDGVWENVEAARAGGRGVVACGAHISNFNLGFLAMAARCIPLQLLMAPGTGGYGVVQALLDHGNLHATQLSADALREAVRRLRSGGMVITGADWPAASSETAELPFFGRPARLPTGHIRLAMSAGAVLLPTTCRWDPVTGYHLLAAPPMELELSGERRRDVRHNALRVLAVLEQWIAACPEQWLMYSPVWANSM